MGADIVAFVMILTLMIVVVTPISSCADAVLFTMFLTSWNADSVILTTNSVSSGADTILFLMNLVFSAGFHTLSSQSLNCK